MVASELLWSVSTQNKCYLMYFISISLHSSIKFFKQFARHQLLKPPQWHSWHRLRPETQKLFQSRREQPVSSRKCCFRTFPGLPWRSSWSFSCGHNSLVCPPCWGPHSWPGSCRKRSPGHSTWSEQWWPPSSSCKAQTQAGQSSHWRGTRSGH